MLRRNKIGGNVIALFCSKVAVLVKEFLFIKITFALCPQIEEYPVRCNIYDYCINFFPTEKSLGVRFVSLSNSEKLFVSSIDIPLFINAALCGKAWLTR